MNNEWNIKYEITHPYFKLSQVTKFIYTNSIKLSEIKRKLTVLGGLRKIEENYEIDHATKEVKYKKGQLIETLKFDGIIYDDLTAHLYLRLLNSQTDKEILLEDCLSFPINFFIKLISKSQRNPPGGLSLLSYQLLH